MLYIYEKGCEQCVRNIEMDQNGISIILCTSYENPVKARIWSTNIIYKSECQCFKGSNGSWLWGAMVFGKCVQVLLTLFFMSTAKKKINPKQNTV